MLLSRKEIISGFEPGFGYNIEMNNCPFTNDYKSNWEHIFETNKMIKKIEEEVAILNKN